MVKMFKEAISFAGEIKKFNGIQSIIWMVDKNPKLIIIYQKNAKKIIPQIELLSPKNIVLEHLKIDELPNKPKMMRAISGEGIMLYGQPIVVSAEDMYLRSRIIINYDTSKMNQSARSRLNRALYGGISTYEHQGKRKVKKYKGLVEEIKAKRIGKAVIIVNRLNSTQITQTLKRFGAEWQEIPVWTP